MKFYTSAEKLGNNILVRGYEDNLPFREKIEYSPTLFVHSKEETGYKDIYGKHCIPVNKDTMYEMDEWKKSMRGVNGMEIMGQDNYTLAFLNDTYNKIKYNFDSLRVGFLDIEVYHRGKFPKPQIAPGIIDAITLYDSKDDKFYVFGLKPWDKKKSTLKDLEENFLDKVVYQQFADEKSLLIAFIQHWRENFLDVVTGWNSNDFDINYLCKRIEIILGEKAMKSLSPWGRVVQRLQIIREVDEKTGYVKKKEKFTTNICGIAQLDYMASYIKFGFRPTRAFYTLDYISYVELNEKKIEYKGSHADMSDNDHQLYIDYNIKDVWLVYKLDVKLSLIRLIVGLAYDANINYEDAFSPVKMWDAIIFDVLKSQKIVLPHNEHYEKEKFEGAYVKEVNPSFHKWIVSFDLTSLYPMLLNQYNISPETIVGEGIKQAMELLVDKIARIENPEYSTAANGMQYTKEFKGVVPEVALKVFNDRIHHKALMKEAKQKGDKAETTLQNVLQMSKKIAINSLYGAIGNRYFRYYDLRNAEAVTLSGQLSIKWIERKLNEYFNNATGIEKDRCIAIDTDSVYFVLDDFVEKFMPGWSDEKICDALDKFCSTKAEKFIQKSYEELAEYMNAYEQRMAMDREAIARTGFWTAKKRYALDVLDMEGYRYTKEEYDKGDNIKIMGLETQKSSTPTFIQDALKECITIILRKDNQDLFNYLNDFETEFKSRDYTDICPISNVNYIQKYSDKAGFPIKGAQLHVKAALCYNRLCKDNDVDEIEDGNKIAVMHLKEPNLLKSPAIAFGPTGLPDDFDKKYILSKFDVHACWNKVFMSPMNLICEAIDWKLEDTTDVTSFFG